MRLSFSQWETYNQCPRKWQYRYVDKLPTKMAIGPAASRGIQVHDAIETYIMADGVLSNPPMPVQHYDMILEEWREKPGGGKYCEFRIGFDPDWYACPPRSTECRWVMVLDAVWVGVDDGTLFGDIGEWKTGKPKDTHTDQRKLYLLGTFRKFGVARARATTYYFDNTSIPQRINAKESAVPGLIKLWDERALRIMNDDFRPCRPSYGCRWCDYSADKGGPCVFGDSGTQAASQQTVSKLTQLDSRAAKNVTPLSGLKPTE